MEKGCVETCESQKVRDKAWMTEDIAFVLDVRSFLYQLFRRVLGEEPDAEMVSAAASPATEDALGFYLGEESGRGREFVRQATQLLEAPAAGDVAPVASPDAVDSLRGEYTRLFIGPQRLEAQPWESVYLSDDNLLFQESTLEVRRAYLSEGLLPAEYPHVADDHIALELAFLACLSKRLDDKGTSRGQAHRLVCVQRDFLDNHLLRWVRDYADRMRAADDGLYRAAVDAMAAFVAADREALEEIDAALR